MRVPLLDLTKQFQLIKPEIDSALNTLMGHQQFILGPEVASLEEKMAAYSGTRFAVGVSSGSDALLISLMALGISSGDEVVTSPFTFFATAGVISRLGARPVFADIDPTTFNIDPGKTEDALTAKTKAILPVHLYGRIASMEQLLKLTESKNISLIEDAAQAVGAKSNLGAAGAMGTMGCLSFFPTKNLGAFGDSGMVITNDENLSRRLRNLRMHGSSEQYIYEEIGGNFRLDALQAAVLLVKLKYLDEWTSKRRNNARRYNALFGETNLPENITPPETSDDGHSFHQYVIRAKDRDKLRSFLKEREIQTGVYYPLPLHLQPCFKHLGYKEGDFPECERASREVLALPVYPELGEDMQEYVVKTIREFYD